MVGRGQETFNVILGAHGQQAVIARSTGLTPARIIHSERLQDGTLLKISQ